RRLRERLDLLLVAHVARERERFRSERLDLARGVVDRARETRVRRLGLGGDDDVAAALRERERDGLADPARASGHDRDASFERLRRDHGALLTRQRLTFF